MKFNIGDEVRIRGESEVFKVIDMYYQYRNKAIYRCESLDNGYKYGWGEDVIELIPGKPMPTFKDFHNLKALSESQSKLLDQRQKCLDLYHALVESQEAEIARLTKIIKDSIDTLKDL